MNRLYLRIFIAFWLVIALIISAVWLLNTRLTAQQADERSQRERIEQLRGELLDGAQQAHAANGEEGLRRWLRQTERRHRQLSLRMITPTGEELRGLDMDPALQRIARRWAETDARMPLQRMGRGWMLLQINEPPEAYLLVLRRQPEPLLLRVLGPLGPFGLLALALGFSALICFLLARTITRPLRELQQVGRALAGGNLDARAGAPWLHRGDELGDLCRDFNRMAEQLQQLMTRQQQLLRDVSHELRSPLARMQVALTLAEDAADEQGRAQKLVRVRHECERLESLISQVLDYSRLFQAGHSTMRALNLSELLEDIAGAASLEGAPRAIDVQLSMPETPVSLNADAELLRRAIENVVRNALRHSPEQGIVAISLSTADSGQLRLDVSDQGEGVADTELETIFEPFVRLTPERSEAGSGGGIGLTIAREALRRHQGSIRAIRIAAGGLCVRMELPLRNTS